MTLRKGWVATIGGILTAAGSLPTLATNSHLALPLWWNDLTAPLNLAGILGVVVLGYVAKGRDDHSTIEQIKAASVAKEAEIMVKTADAAPTAITEVEIAKPKPINIPPQHK